jgi:hypothetical protein
MSVNIWSEFNKLTDKSSFTIGTIVSHDNGESIVECSTGQFRASGTSVNVGVKAYISNGIIVGDAPDLPTVGPFYV